MAMMMTEYEPPKFTDPIANGAMVAMGWSDRADFAMAVGRWIRGPEEFGDHEMFPPDSVNEEIRHIVNIHVREFLKWIVL